MTTLWRCFVSISGVLIFVLGLVGGYGAPYPEQDAKLRHMPFGKSDTLNFAEPPRSFYPETWFHFIGGNVATQGITADLEAIAAAGISGVQLFHGQFGGAWPGVEPQIRCLSESWDGAVRHMALECRRLGLRFTMQNCPGWAMAGGPWIKPENAMRHLVWSRTDLVGGGDVSVLLPKPQPSKEKWRAYRDVAVMAFPTPLDDTGAPLAPARIRSNREDLPWKKCLRNEMKGQKIILEAGTEPVWIETTFDDLVTLRTVELPSVQEMNHEWCYVPGVSVTVEAMLPEGTREVVRCDLPRSNWQGRKPISLACSEVAAKTYRITISHKHKMAIGQIQLFSAARKHNWQAEAAFVLGGLDRSPPPTQSRRAWVDPSQTVDLTARMDEKGALKWEAPPGAWTVLRWGHVNTGMKNGPAPPEATGWECDKLSPAGADAHFAGYIGRILSPAGPASGGLLGGMLLDSWECETQTWTPGMDKEFLRLRGYPVWSSFPALAGYVVGDPEHTARFLRDWRVTISDLIVSNFFGRMASLGNARGLAISFETASGDVFPGDILEYYKHADVPMCEFWRPRMESFVGSFDFKPVKPTVSAARMYGKPRVAAEAFTSFDLSWNEHPGMLKPIADMHLAEGVSHLVFHTYTHNPRTDFLPPGTSFGSGIGTPFLRGQTWWKHMPAFTSYLARCGYLLERGRSVTDVLWYLGDEQDHKPRQDAPFPEGYRYDYCNPDALLHRLSVERGRLVTPESLQYRLLWLPECPRMTPDTLERMLTLVRKGAILVGDPPRGLATLSGGVDAEKRFRSAVEALWGKSAEVGRGQTRKVGKGRVLSGGSLGDALAQLDIQPDLQGRGVLWSHRQTERADWYFVAATEGFRGQLTFRSVGDVEFWNPLTGLVTLAEQLQRKGEATRVAVDIPPAGSVFVVFNRSDTKARAAMLASGNSSREIKRLETISLNGRWDLSFPGGWGAPALVRLDQLKSWTELDLSPEGRAFSGTATYTTGFEIGSLDPGVRLELDLGRVEVIGTIRVNGVAAGTVWAPPHRLEITRLVKPGRNRLEVEVTSTWFNRLVYDAGLDEPARKTWTISGPAKDKALMPSGLLGPVMMQVVGAPD